MSKHRGEISREEFEQIERYLLNEMEASEQEQFEVKLASDETLQHEVALQRQLLAAVEAGSFQQKNRGSKGEGKTMRKLFVTKWYAAAAVLLLTIVGAWYFYVLPLRETDLFTSYFQPDPGLPVVMGNNTVSYAFNDAMISYKEEKYTDAIAVWEGLAAQIGTSDTLEYYIGVANLNMGNLSKAEPYLAQIAQNSHSAFQRRAIWYLALLKIKEGEQEKAGVLLKQLPDREEAVRLLEKLRKNMD